MQRVLTPSRQSDIIDLENIIASRCEFCKRKGVVAERATGVYSLAAICRGLVQRMAATPKNFMDFSQEIARQLREAIAVKEEMLSQDVPLIADLARLLSRTLRAGRKAVIFGNGGSAADAQHVATELVNRFEMERKALPVMALTTDTSMLTAVGNDYSFERIFARQVEALVEAGDVAIGLSTSGRSANVLKGLEAAREKGAVTVGFTGRAGGPLKDAVDLCYCAPSDRTARIQEAHITAWHIICYLVERELFG